MIATCSPRRTLAGAPGELSINRDRRHRRRTSAHDEPTSIRDRSSPPIRIPGPTTATCAPTNTALIVIDMQTDFCGKGGYVDPMGYDISLTRAPHRADPGACSPPMRAAGFHVIHTREGHRPDLSDLPANKRWRSRRIGAGHRRSRARAAASSCAASRAGRSSPSSPRAGRAVIDKPGKGSFCATDLELILRTRGIANLVLTGITTDVCVHTTMREAQRPRLRVPAARGLLPAPPTTATTTPRSRWSRCRAACSAPSSRSADAACAWPRRCLMADRRRAHRAARPRAVERRGRRHDQALRRLHRARRRVAARRARARSTRCWARTAPARARW